MQDIFLSPSAHLIIQCPQGLHSGPTVLTDEKRTTEADMWSACPLVPTVDHHALTVRTIKTNTDRLVVAAEHVCPRLLI